MSDAAARLLDAVKASNAAPYLDVLQRAAGLTAAEADFAMRQLVSTGLLMRCSAPGGVLLYPTLRCCSE